MQPIDQCSNTQLLSSLAGPKSARLLMDRFGGLGSLARASVEELQDLKGIGKAKAVAIKSAFQLAQRLSQESYSSAPLLDSPDLVANLLRESNRLYMEERLQVAMLNTRRRLIAVEEVGKGLVDSVLVHPREVYSRAISRRASGIILVHNHPSGDPTPSEADIRMTRDMAKAGQLLKIELVDHIILGSRTSDRPNDFCSLRQLGILPVS